MVADPGDAPIEKSATTIWMLTGCEKKRPLLLAMTFILVAPNGQFMVEAGPVPQPPVQLNTACGHAVGSGNPNWEAVRLAPLGVLPTTKRVGAPLKTGIVSTAAARAL